jgi:hypothetical protein
VKVCYLTTGQSTKYDLFIRVALTEDLPARRLRRGDVATVVEQHPGRPGQEPGYTTPLEIFNAVGDSVDVVTVRESQIEPLTANELLTVRSLAVA